MKNILLAILISFTSVNAFALDVYFRGGLSYRSEYNDHVGRASVIMTSNPEYVLISVDRNKCDGQGCTLVSYPGDLNLALYRLTKVKEADEHVTYEATALPLSDLGRKMYISEYEANLQKTKITIDADVSWEKSFGGSLDMRMPKTLVLSLGEPGRLRRYVLDHIESVSL